MAIGYQRIEVNESEVWRFSCIYETLTEAIKNPWDYFIDGISYTYILGPYTLHYGNGKRIKFTDPVYASLYALLDSGRISNNGGTNYRVSYPMRYILNASPLRDLDTKKKYVVTVHWPLDGRDPEISSYEEFWYRTEQDKYFLRLKGDPADKGPIFKALYLRGTLADHRGWTLCPEDPLYQCMVGMKCHIDFAEKPPSNLCCNK